MKQETGPTQEVDDAFLAGEPVQAMQGVQDNMQGGGEAHDDYDEKPIGIKEDG